MLHQIKGIEKIDSPALVVIHETVIKNIDEMVRMVDGDVNRLRPHVKTHKTAEGIKLMQAVGINKFKCATIAEAELLGMNNATDVLLAYQPLGPKIERLFQLTQQYPATIFSCLTDNIEVANQIGQLFHQHGTEINIYIDINVGMNRTGILPNQGAIELHDAIQKIKGLCFAGIHAYDGHIRQSNSLEKEILCNEVFQPVLSLMTNFSSRNTKKPILIAGGSLNFATHSTKTDRESSPGTPIFWDHGYQTICPDQAYSPALFVLTRIISLPTQNRICVDLGYKAIASEDDISKRVYFPLHPSLIPVAHSEEHLILETPTPHTFKIGDILTGIPNHVCPTVALYDSLIEVKKNEVSGAWQVLARRRKINC